MAVASILSVFLGHSAIAGADVKGKSGIEAVWAAGMMSGTSLDGVDLAVLQTDGVSIFGFGETRYRAFSQAEQAVLTRALGSWPGDANVPEAARLVEDAHIEVARGMNSVEILGFHGQTLAHDPSGRGTHQAGDGARLADALGITTVWDFRSSDVALGGQGAPLAPFYHWACARWAGYSAPVAFLNLGGVGNLTWVDPTKDRPEDPGALLAFDTGPANAPMNDLAAKRGIGVFDPGGEYATRGHVTTNIVSEFMTSPYFSALAPKSLDRNAFSNLAQAVDSLSTEDALATLCACSAAAIAKAMTLLPSPPCEILVSGGGTRNAALMREIAAQIDIPIRPIDTVGLSPDHLEAQAFAYLAVRVLRGMATSCPGTTGVAANVAGGTITRADGRGA